MTQNEIKNEKLKMDGTQTDWINVGKFLAIMAVITNHNPFISNTTMQLSFFAVSLFILNSGVTSYISCGKNYARRGFNETLRRISKIFIPYAFATAFYQVYNYGVLNIADFWTKLVNFNASLPFYFIIFYIQLVIIAPLLFDLVCFINSRRYSYIGHVVVFFMAAGISVLLIRHTLFPGIYGGGAYMLGGTYLILFYLGMAFAGFNFKFKTKIAAGTVFVASIVGIIAWGNFYINNLFQLDAKFPFGFGMNPPGISLMINALIMFVLVFSFCSLVGLFNNKAILKIQKFFSWIGGYSLYIFLYHSAVITLIKNRNIENLTVNKILVPVLCVFLPVACAWIYQKIKMKYHKVVQRNGV